VRLRQGTNAWKLIGTGTNGGGTIDACVGPGLVTVQQVKNFKNDQEIAFDSNWVHH